MARRGHVYVMRIGMDRVKVGVSMYPRKRALSLGGLELCFVSEWHDRAGEVEFAAQRVLKFARKHVVDEIFAVTVDEAVAAIEKAIQIVADGNQNSPEAHGYNERQ